MEKLIYKRVTGTTVVKNVTDLTAKEFMVEIVDLMRMLGYDDNHIKNALDETTL